MNGESLTEATSRLIDLLKAENAALQVMDFKAAAELLTEKQAATLALTEAQAAALYAPPGLDGLARQLNALADENRALLERAIAVQRRVLGTVVRAAQAAAPEPQYGPSGSPASRNASAMALRANA